MKLNARTSILAAANPRDSRYDTSRSIMHNVNMPAALLSRFDLTFLLLDVPNSSDNRYVAAHLLKTLQGNGADGADGEGNNIEGADGDQCDGPIFSAKQLRCDTLLIANAY
jgi:DNA replicative helicase MCM subunit Mcm2 (Cdc46/Mcm family)